MGIEQTSVGFSLQRLYLEDPSMADAMIKAVKRFKMAGRHGGESQISKDTVDRTLVNLRAGEIPS